MTIEELNSLSAADRKTELTKCCGSSSWVEAVNKIFPVTSFEELLQGAHNAWQNVSTADVIEAFQHHPKIGDITSLKEKYANTLQLAAGEQSGVNIAPQKIIEELAEGNKLYEAKFGYIFIVCATGKSAAEMLALLKQRLPNDSVTEIEIAKAEQMKITIIRLEKLIT